LTGDPVAPKTGATPRPVSEGVPGGRVGRAHGLDGSFYVTRPRARLLTLGAAVVVAEQPTTIVRRAGTDERPIVRLEGIDDRNAAEAMRGSELLISGADAPTLGEQEWWAHELEGCEVVDGERLLGTVSKLIELPSCEALEVTPTGGGEVVLVPLVKDAIRRVIPSQRRIEVDLDFLGLGVAAQIHDGPAAQQRQSGGDTGTGSDS
jgi:16S rRNA processing protein RimM